MTLKSYDVCGSSPIFSKISNNVWYGNSFVIDRETMFIGFTSLKSGW